MVCVALQGLAERAAGDMHLAQRERLGVEPTAHLRLYRVGRRDEQLGGR
jgi:hypothetical protein